MKDLALATLVAFAAALASGMRDTRALTTSSATGVGSDRSMGLTDSPTPGTRESQFPPSHWAERLAATSPDPMTACEAATHLLAMGRDALPAIATHLNSTDAAVARRFFGIALWAWQPTMVGTILAELAQNGARNMQVYALLGHLTMRALAVEERGALLADWQAWHAAHAAATMDDWWKDGFHRAGIELSSVRTRAAIPALIDALLRDDAAIHIAALHLLQRLTYRDARSLHYLELPEYRVTRAVEHAFPDPSRRPALDAATLHRLIHADWKAWYAAHAERSSADWAREEAGYAVDTLEVLARRGELSRSEQATGFAANVFLHRLTRNAASDAPVVTSLPWTNALTDTQMRARLIPGIGTRVELALEKLRAVEPSWCWWPYGS